MVHLWNETTKCGKIPWRIQKFVDLDNINW
jgi:hypothetical protein